MNGQKYKKVGKPVREMLPETERTYNVGTILLLGIPANDEGTIK
jgi:hypothetical protein